MFHFTSGHNNFDLIRPEHSPTLPFQQISADQAKTIQQQTSEAIKVATKSDNTKNNNISNSKYIKKADSKKCRLC